jgi:hypothetical protein
MITLEIDELKAGLPTLSPNVGRFLSEAALFCLESQGHRSGVKLLVKGTINETYQVKWDGYIDNRVLYRWRDLDEAVEYGATCVAILLVLKSTGYNSVERSFKGTGFDFWVGIQSGDFPFQRKLRLEISGIYNGNESTINYRAKLKLKQTNRSDSTELAAIIVIVEFSQPMSKYLEK